MKLIFTTCLVVAIASLGPLAQAKKPQAKAWIDPTKALAEDLDFAVQGEYAGGGLSYAVQVIARGQGKFDAVVFEQGLPAKDSKSDPSRLLLSGGRTGDVIKLTDEKGAVLAEVGNGKLLLELAGGAVLKLSRIDRKSPTLGAKPPTGAEVLFDGSSADAWNRGVLKDGLLRATGATSKKEYGSYHLHLEFRTPYMPDARGQKRGNSGVYHSGRWETQILDTFGLPRRDNHCGGIYSISKPRLNMCLPPLAWQTYDVDFTAAKFDADGKRTAWPRITVKLNGVLIHEDLELAKNFTTSAPITSAVTTPNGPVHLQDHNNPVVFRNIWIVPK